MGFYGIFVVQMTQTHAVYPQIWHATFVTCHHASSPSFLSVSSVNYQRLQKKKLSQKKKNKCKDASSQTR